MLNVVTPESLSPINDVIGATYPVLDIKPYQRFTLNPQFVEQYRFKRPDWGPVGEITFRRTYARRKLDGNLEEWWETVKRVVEGIYTYQKWHCMNLQLPWRDSKGQRSAQMMYKLIFDMKFLPPGRGLWMCGTSYVEKYGGAALNNCAFVSTQYIDQDFADPFCFLMDMSMLGVGVGGDCAGAGKVTIQQPIQGDDIHVVDDSREGWVEIIRRILNTYVGRATVPARIDYSQVRPAGAPIKGFGGIAAGAGPLIYCVEQIQLLLNAYIGRAIDSRAITWLFDLIGVCVVSGNVRRSAIIMLGEDSDKGFNNIKDNSDLKILEADYRRVKKEFRGVYWDITNPQMKRPEGYWPEGWSMIDLKIRSTVDFRREYATSIAEYPVLQDLISKMEELENKIYAHPLMTHLWASNNSTKAEVGMNYTEAARLTGKNGEPGYLWMDTVRKYGRMADPPNNLDRDAVGTNPCSEQTLCHKELCCLVETFPSRHSSYEEYQKTLKWAYLYAKTVTLIPTHNRATNAVMARNRRIGCSQSGIVESFTKIGRREHIRWCDKGYVYLRKLDEIYADWLGVPRSRKITSIKPSGTVSLLPGVTPGIHYPHSEYYYRTMRVAWNNPLIKALRDAGYRMEDDRYDIRRQTAVVYFPVHEKNFDRSKDQVSMWEQLANAAVMQRYWADNQVSITVTFNESESKDISKALEMYEDQLKSVSFLPLNPSTGDEEEDECGYVQAPYQTITKEEYEAAIIRLRQIDFSLARHDIEDKYCDGDKCSIPAPPTPN